MQDLNKYTKRNQIEIKTNHLSLIMVGTVALVGLVFALGVVLGAGKADNSSCPAPDPLSGLDRLSGEPTPSFSSQAIDLSFHESLLADPEATPTPASLLVKKQSAKTEEETEIEEANKQSPADAQETPPAPMREEPPVPETVPASEPGIYSLQVGSFQDQREANVMVRKLGRAGHKAFLVSVNMPDRGGRWYRIRIGPFETNQKAWEYKKTFESKERLPAFVVKRKRS